MIKMVVFDLDGTLVNTLGGIAGACNYVLEKNGYETTPIDEYMNYVGNGLAMTIFRALPDKKKAELLAASNAEELQSKSDDLMITNHLDLKHLLGEPNFDVPELKSLIHELLEFYKLNPTIDSHLYEGVEEVLSFLDENNIKWGIHTNKTASIAKDVADEFIDPTRYLGLRGPDGVIPRKPNPEGSLDLIRIAKDVELEEVVYIGDTEVDIETAKELGVPVIAVSYGFRKREILEPLNPDYLIDEPLEIIKILSAMI